MDHAHIVDLNAGTDGLEVKLGNVHQLPDAGVEDSQVDRSGRRLNIADAVGDRVRISDVKRIGDDIFALRGQLAQLVLRPRRHSQVRNLAVEQPR